MRRTRSVSPGPQAGGQQSRSWPVAGAPGQDGPVPLKGLVQLFRRDIPTLASGPDGADLVQIFRCPFTHGPYGGRSYLLRWRHSREAERAERILAAVPEVPLLRGEDELPEPCVLHPEEAQGSVGSSLPPQLGEGQFAVPEAERQIPSEELSMAGSPRRPPSHPCQRH